MLRQMHGDPCTDLTVWQRLYFSGYGEKVEKQPIVREYAATLRAWDLITHQYSSIYDFVY